MSLSNVAEAYERSTPREFRREFAWSPEEVARAERWGAFAAELTTNLHEIIGHGSGLVSEALKGAPEKALKEHSSAIEEARADLVALYFVADPYLVEIGIVEADSHAEIVVAEYEAYARNALVQLRRIREGAQIEEDHMRNRQLIVHWLLANTDAIEITRRAGKTYYRMADASAFRAGSAGCSPRSSGFAPKATTPPRTSCWRPTACISIPTCATRSSPVSIISTCRRTPAS